MPNSMPALPAATLLCAARDGQGIAAQPLPGGSRHLDEELIDHRGEPWKTGIARQPLAPRRHVEPPPLPPLAAPLGARPGLEPRGVEPGRWHELDGELHRGGDWNRLLVALSRGGPRHRGERSGGTSERQYMAADQPV